MTIKTYRFLGDSRKIDKTLTAVSAYSNAVIVGDMSIHTPTISLQLDSFTDVINFNYIYILELRRYYYVVDSTIREDGFVLLQCKVDVLKSFKTDILASTQYVERQQNKCTFNYRITCIILRATATLQLRTSVLTLLFQIITIF